MKIALIVNLFPPKWLGGTEIASYNIAKYLAKKGHEIHVITSFDASLPQIEIKDRFHIHRINFNTLRYIGFIHFRILIFLKLREIDPDLVHIQGVTMTIPGFLSKIFLKKPYIVWGRGSDIYKSSKFMKLISKTLLKNADAMIALTKTMKDAMLKIYQGAIYVIPNGIDLEKFKDISVEINHNDKNKTIIFVGTLRPVKGIFYLIEAMRIIKNEYCEAQLLIVGDGVDRDKLRAIVKELNLGDSVSFVGQISNQEIPKYMAKSDIFVLPSLSEGFPNVILEAMAAGLPIIASTVGGIPDFIQNGVHGFLVEPMNSEELAEKISILLNNKDIREKMSINNKIEVQKYSIDSVIENLEFLYAKTINHS